MSRRMLKRHTHAADGHVITRAELARQRHEEIMATLDNLTAALTDLGADIDKVAADVLAALADLRAQIDVLVAGAVTQEQIDALTASVDTADADVTALDDAVPEQLVLASLEAVEVTPEDEL